MSKNNLRNAKIRSKEFNHPAGDTMVELQEAQLDRVIGGAGPPVDHVSHKKSCGKYCTFTGECQGRVTNIFCC